MKSKKRILFGFILLLVVNLCGCSNGGDEEQIVEGFNITENNEDNKASVASLGDVNRINVEDLASWVKEKKAEETKADTETIEAEEEVVYDIRDWETAYAEFIEAYTEEMNYHSFAYSLIYVNDDDIPELVIDSGIEAGGCLILTFYNGMIDEVSTGLSVFYLEKQNSLYNPYGHMGYYNDRVYSIEDGKWVCIGAGRWMDEYMVEVDGHTYYPYTYEWDDKEVDEDTYMKKLNAVFDIEHQMRPEYHYNEDEILSLLRTGVVASDT